LGAAYEVLSDSDKRKVYDRSGEEGVQKMGNGGFGNQHGAFNSFFGDFFGGGHHEDSDEVPKGANVVVDLYATLEEVIILFVLQLIILLILGLCWQFC
jgi:DnaJ family protein B protein 11